MSIEIELVFEAKIAPAGATPSRSDQNRRFTSTSSKIASTTSPASAASAGSAEARIRRERLVAVSLEAALRDRPLEVAGDPVATRLGSREVRLVEDDAPAARGEDLGDAVAHQPGAADEDVLDRHRVRA